MLPGFFIAFTRSREGEQSVSSTCLIKENIIIVWHITLGGCTGKITYISEKERGAEGKAEEKRIGCLQSPASDVREKPIATGLGDRWGVCSPPSGAKTKQIGEAIHFPEPWEWRSEVDRVSVPSPHSLTKG